MQQVTEWSAAIISAFATALAVLLSFLPKIIGFFVIIVLGWLAANLLASAVAVLLRKLRFNEVSAKAGIAAFIERAHLRSDASGMVAFVVKWFIRLIALVVAFDALGLPAISEIFTELLNWIPNLLVAMVILVIGGWAANVVQAIVRGAAVSAEAQNAEMLAGIAKSAIWVLTFVIAINQLGVAANLLQTLFAAMVGALALGLALAIGLGGKDLAGELLRKWCENTFNNRNSANTAQPDESQEQMPPQVSSSTQAVKSASPAKKTKTPKTD